MPPRTDRWMCPAHAEQIIDDHVATSSRLSERVRLWNEFARRDDPDTRPHNVKMRFLRRVTTQRHRRLMTNGRTHNRPKMQVRVPDGVKLLYQHPPLLEPRLGDCVTPSVNPPPLHPSSNASLSPTEEDKDTVSSNFHETFLIKDDMSLLTLYVPNNKWAFIFHNYIINYQ